MRRYIFAALAAMVIAGNAWAGPQFFRQPNYDPAAVAITGGTITGVTSINITGDADIGGEATVVGNITGASVTTSASATPGVGFYDVDGTDPDLNALIYFNLTATGTGVEQGNTYFQSQGAAGTAGTMQTYMYHSGATQALVMSAAFGLGNTTVTATGPTDNVNVTGKNVVFIDTSSNNVTIGGFIGGVAGQMLFVVVTDAANNAVLEHAEATGNQDIYLQKGADETFAAKYGGWTLICNGTHWYQAGNTDTDT